MRVGLKHAAVLVALLFVTAATPVQAEASVTDEGTCYACQMCYEEISCLACGVMTLNAISGCCGLGAGTAYCVPDYGGFAVNCANERACQCGMAGDGCDPLVSGG